MVRFSKKIKFAYSLLEASIVLIMVSVIISLSTNVIVSKIKSKTNTRPHGRFECYYVGNDLMQHSVINDRDFGVQKSSNKDFCLFKPNQYVRYLVANVVGAGAPAVSNMGGTAGQFESKFFSSPAYNYFLYPGKPVSSSKALTDAQIKSMKSYIRTSIISGKSEFYPVIASGGTNSNGISNISPDKLQSCNVVMTNSQYDCNIAPSCTIVDNGYQGSSSLRDTLKCYPLNNTECTIEDKKIIVGYCSSKTSYRTVEYNLYDILSYDNLLEPVKGKTNVWNFYSDVYYKERGCQFPGDSNKETGSETCEKLYSIFNVNEFKNVNSNKSPCLFKLELRFNLPGANENGEISQLTRYVKSMQFYETKAGNVNLNSGIASVSPGDGGSPSSKDGHTGGIVLLY